MKLTLILGDLSDFPAMNRVYSEVMSAAGVTVLPARTTFEAGRNMPRGAK